MTIDLHLHSTHSDGLFSPKALCRMAAKARVTLLSLTDHDTVSGLDAMRKAAAEIGLPPPLCGVELSCGTGGRVHVLGYGPAVQSPALLAVLEKARQRRRERVTEMLRVLSEMGMPLDAALLPQQDSRPVGRAHVARALAQAGYVRTLKEAFTRFLGEGKPANIPMRRLSACEAIRLLRDIGAVPVLAHPLRSGYAQEALPALLPTLIQSGLMGMEVYHSSCNAAAARQLDATARAFGLLVTGGSDFHGDAGSTLHIGHLPAGWTRAADDVDRLMQAAGA